MLYCLGNALVDYEFCLSEEQLKKLGIEKGLMTLANQEQFNACFNSLGSKFKYQRAGGGSAVNSLITYLRFGGTGALSCIVAKDDSGDFFLEELKNLGATLDVSRINNKSIIPTGHCIAIITPDAERTMLTYLGINEELDIYPHCFKTLATAEVFYAESYLLAVKKSGAVLMKYLAEARLQGKLIALSLSDISMVKHFRQEIHRMLDGGVDILFGNLGEFGSYSGEREPSKILKFFTNNGYNIKTLVITMGDRGAFIISKDITIEVPAYETRLKDTLGAGDTYAGAFLYSIFEKQADYELAAKFANYAAAQVVARMGPRLSKQECQDLLVSFDWQE